MDLLAVHEPSETLLGPEDAVGVELLGGLAALEDFLPCFGGAKIMLALVIQVARPRVETVVPGAFP
jgi:hypothetical protein